MVMQGKKERGRERERERERERVQRVFHDCINSEPFPTTLYNNNIMMLI